MNIDFSTNRQQTIITIYTCIWLVGSLIVSAIFSFCLFPTIYDARTSANVTVYFQTKNPSDGSTYYFPNFDLFRKEHLKNLSDPTYLYFSSCDTLPLSQRPKCDGGRNWIKFDPREINCSDVATCTSTTYTLGETQRQKYFAAIIPVNGASISISDLSAPSLSDPGGWGHAAKWPLFFICFFLALKLGRSLGEFIFTPYQK